MGEFRLDIREFRSPTAWRWVLTGLDGTLIADYEVRLDATCWQFEAFTDLLYYLDGHVAPDQRAEGEKRIVAQLGAWIGAQVFGPVGEALLSLRPATVRVVAPASPDAARLLLLRPLELAHVRGHPLALRDVTLVMQLGAETPERQAEGLPSARTGCGYSACSACRTGKWR